MPPSSTVTAPSCLITNESVPFGAIKAYFAVNPDSLSDDEVAKLRSSWGLDDDSFKSKHNEVYLRADWAGSLSRDSWTFVPPHDTLQLILRSLLRLKNNHKNASWHSVCPKDMLYTYRFIPFNLQGAVITRLIASAGRNANHTPVPTIYLPPYNDFPVLKSNAHPYFVIYEALAQFHSRARSDELTDEQLQIYSTLMHVNSLWEGLRQFPLDDKFLGGGASSGNDATPRGSQTAMKPSP